MRSSNPILRESVLKNSYDINSMPMTVSGTVNKLILLALIMLVAGGAVYYQFSLQHIDYVNIMAGIGFFVGLVLSFVITFMPKTAPYLSPVYAFAEGAFLAGTSCYFESLFPGIVIQAVSITFLVILAMAFLYKIGAIKATEKFRAVMFIAMTAILIFYLASIVMSFFGHVPAYFTTNTPTTIGINIVIAIIAALSLILDFDFIEKGSQANLPSVFEWYGAFGLLVTIIWLYIEILRLLARTRRQ